MALIEWQDVTDTIKRAVPLREVFQRLGWKIRGKRAECRLKKHSQKLTVACDEHLWHCHACNVGGDIFRLIELAHGCDFATALKFLAAEARVELPGKQQLSPRERRRLEREAKERKQREARIDGACAELKERERQLRVKIAGYLHQIDDLLRLPSPWSEEQWRVAGDVCQLRDEELLPAFTLLAFGTIQERVRYLGADAEERSVMCRAIRWAGGIVSSEGHFVEVAI